MSHVVQSRKPYKTATSTTGRPRGRPPNVNKNFPNLQYSDSMNNQFNSKGAYSNYLNSSTGNRSLMNPYCLNPLFDPSMFAAMLTSGMSGGMMDPLSTMNYLNQMGSYQDILRQYQSNLSSMTNLATSLSNASSSVKNSNALTMSTASSSLNTTPNLGNFGNLNNFGNLTVKQMLNLANSSALTTPRSSTLYQQTSTKTATTTSTIKERPDISITPVGSSIPYKQKPSKHVSQNDPFTIHLSKQAQANKSIPLPPTSQVSLLKSSVIQNKSAAPKQIPTPPKQIPTPPKQIPAPPKQISTPANQVSASQIRLPKSLIEPQPAHNSSFSHSALKGSSVANQSLSGLNVKSSVPSSIQAGHSGTSLQHKLLSKKQPQLSTTVPNPMKKQRSNKLPPPIASTFQNLLSTLSNSSQSFLPSELSGLSVRPIPKAQNSKPSSFRKQKPLKPSMDVPSSLAQSKTAEAFSMLSQLQQHSHLEIIPQQKNQTKTLEFAKNLPSSLSVVPQGMTETVKPTGDSISVFELPRKTGIAPSSKRNEKPAAKDNVEIITLDD